MLSSAVRSRFLSLGFQPADQALLDGSTPWAKPTMPTGYKVPSSREMCYLEPLHHRLSYFLSPQINCRDSSSQDGPRERWKKNVHRPESLRKESGQCVQIVACSLQLQ